MAKSVNSELIKKTKLCLKKLLDSPTVTDKLLERPPFRFLHDVICGLINKYGCLKGLYTETDMKVTSVMDKDLKIAFLNKVLLCVSYTLKEDVEAKAKDIVEGKACERTNIFLQQLYRICNENLDTSEAVTRVLSELVSDEKTSPVSVYNKQVSSSETKSRVRSTSRQPAKEQQFRKPSMGKKSAKVKGKSKRPRMPSGNHRPVQNTDEKREGNKSKVIPIETNSPPRPSPTTEKSSPPRASPTTEKKMPLDTPKTPASANMPKLDSEPKVGLTDDDIDKNTDILLLKGEENKDSTDNRMTPENNNEKPKGFVPITDWHDNVKQSIQITPGIIPDGYRSTRKIEDDNEFLPDLADTDNIYGTTDFDSPDYRRRKSSHSGILVHRIRTSKAQYGGAEESVGGTDKSAVAPHSTTYALSVREVKDLEQLRSGIQQLCKSANPLGQSMVYIQEDLDAMQKELEKWAEDNRVQQQILKQEELAMKATLDPLYNQIQKTELEIQEQQRLIADVKGRILLKDESTSQILSKLSSTASELSG